MHRSLWYPPSPIVIVFVFIAVARVLYEAAMLQYKCISIDTPRMYLHLSPVISKLDTVFLF